MPDFGGRRRARSIPACASTTADATDHTVNPSLSCSGVPSFPGGTAPTSISMPIGRRVCSSVPDRPRPRPLI
jgi:hypothetical protein